MSKQIGRLRKVGIAKETVKGTAVVPAYWLHLTEFDPAPQINVKDKEGAIGRIEDSNGASIVQKWSTPKFGGYITDKAIGLIGYLTFGAVSSATKSGESAVYEHTLTMLNTNEHPSFTISHYDSNLQKQIPYCLANKTVLEALVDDYFKYTVEAIGKMEATTTGLSASFAEENVFVPKTISLKTAANVAGLAAASNLCVQRFSLEVNKNVEANFALTSDEPCFINNKQVEIKGTIEVIESDTTWRDLFTAGTAKAMELIAEDTATTIGSTSHPKIDIVLANVKFNTYKEDIGLNDLIKETIEFKGYYSIADTKAISAVITNTEATI